LKGGDYMKKSGISVQNEALPHGFALRYHVNRSQPFTLWRGDEVIFFANTMVEAVAFAKGDK